MHVLDRRVPTCFTSGARFQERKKSAAALTIGNHRLEAEAGVRLDGWNGIPNGAGWWFGVADVAISAVVGWSSYEPKPMPNGCSFDVFVVYPANAPPSPWQPPPPSPPCVLGTQCFCCCFFAMSGLFFFFPPSHPPGGEGPLASDLSLSVQNLNSLFLTTPIPWRCQLLHAAAGWCVPPAASHSYIMLEIYDAGQQQQQQQCGRKDPILVIATRGVIALRCNPIGSERVARFALVSEKGMKF